MKRFNKRKSGLGSLARGMDILSVLTLLGAMMVMSVVVYTLVLYRWLWEVFIFSTMMGIGAVIVSYLLAKTFNHLAMVGHESLDLIIKYNRINHKAHKLKTIAVNAPDKVSLLTLSESAKSVILDNWIPKLFELGFHFFIYGTTGAGKTTIVREIIKNLEVSNGKPVRLFVIDPEHENKDEKDKNEFPGAEIIATNYDDALPALAKLQQMTATRNASGNNPDNWVLIIDEHDSLYERFDNKYLKMVTDDIKTDRKRNKTNIVLGQDWQVGGQKGSGNGFSTSTKKNFCRIYLRAAGEEYLRTYQTFRDKQALYDAWMALYDEDAMACVIADKFNKHYVAKIPYIAPITSHQLPQNAQITPLFANQIPVTNSANKTPYEAINGQNGQTVANSISHNGQNDAHDVSLGSFIIDQPSNMACPTMDMAMNRARELVANNPHQSASQLAKIAEGGYRVSFWKTFLRIVIKDTQNAHNATK